MNSGMAIQASHVERRSAHQNSPKICFGNTKNLGYIFYVNGQMSKHYSYKAFGTSCSLILFLAIHAPYETVIPLGGEAFQTVTQCMAVRFFFSLFPWLPLVSIEKAHVYICAH